MDVVESLPSAILHAFQCRTATNSRSDIQAKYGTRPPHLGDVCRRGYDDVRGEAAASRVADIRACVQAGTELPVGESVI